MCVESEAMTFRLYMTFPNGDPLSRAIPFAAVDVELLFAVNIMDVRVGVAVPLLVVNRVLATLEAPAPECRNAAVTLVESAEASVVRNREATSGKRLANKIEPPKTNPGFDYSRSRQTFLLGGTLLGGATAMPIGAEG
jgi:hypothetical protein